MKSNRKFVILLEILVITFLVMSVVTVCGQSESGSPDISASPSIVNPGDEITVTYSGAPGSYFDWIAIFKVGEQDIYEYGLGKLQYILEGKKSGTLTITAPDEPGDYELRLFEDDGYTDIARSNVVRVQEGTTVPTPTPTIGDTDISASPSIVNPGDEITVTYSGAPGFELDWIAMYRVGDPNEGEYGEWQYLEGKKSGTLIFTAPDEPGDYEFRLFESVEFTDIARSNIVTVQEGTTVSIPTPTIGDTDISASPSIVNPGDEITVTYSGAPGFELDWIAMYGVGDPNEGEYGEWQYLEGKKSGTLIFTAPDEPGDYEFRLFESVEFTDIARSIIVTVQEGTTVSTPTPTLTPTTTQTETPTSTKPPIKQKSAKTTPTTTPAETPTLTVECPPGFKWVRMSGVGCVQKDCLAIEHAKLSYTGACICEDGYKACYESVDYTNFDTSKCFPNCPGARLVACVKLGEPCPGEEEEETEFDYPDLVILNAEFGKFSDDMRVLVLSVRVANRGNAGASETQVYAWDPESGMLSEYNSVPALLPGEDEWVGIELAIPEEQRGITHTFRVEVDPEDEVREIDEGNNVERTPGIFIPPLEIPPTPTEPALFILIVVAIATLGGITLTIRHYTITQHHKKWQEEAKDEEPPEHCQYCTHHCRKIELELDPAMRKIAYLRLGAYDPVHSEQIKDGQVTGEIVDGLNKVVSARHRRVNAEKLQELVTPQAHALLQQIMGLLREELSPRDVSLSGHLEGGKVTCQFILYHCKRRGNVNIWEEEAKWEATIKDERDELVGILHSIDPAELGIPEQVAPDLTRLLMQFIEKV